MKEPFEPKRYEGTAFTNAHALVFIGQSIMYGLYLVAEAIKYKK